MSKYFKLIYIGRSRLHRNRANLIQTLQTVAAFTQLGIQTTLLLPPWHKGVTAREKTKELGIKETLDIRPVQLLHRRWPIGLFVSLYKRRLKHADAIYVRSPEISLSLSSHGIIHSLEIHTLRKLIKNQSLSKIIHYHKTNIVSHLFPISHTSAEALIKAGADPNRVHISPSGVDLSAYQSIPKLDVNNLRSPRIIYLGRISHDRGLGIFCKLASEELGSVLLVGNKDEDIPQQKNLIHKPPIPHKEVPALYAESDLVLLPYQPELSHADGISPLKLFEAMAAGRPIIASDLPPIREILKNKHNALLVSPDDINEWIAAINILKQDQTLATHLINHALEDVNAFSWANRAKHISDILKLHY